MRLLRIEAYQGNALVPEVTIELPPGTNTIEVTAYYSVQDASGKFSGGGLTRTITLSEEPDADATENLAV